jgi:hypothetical protein
MAPSRAICISRAVIPFMLYRKGIGFSPSFKKLKCKEEYGIVITLIILSLISTSIMLYYNGVWLNMIFFALVSGFFIYYAIGKEYRDDGNDGLHDYSIDIIRFLLHGTNDGSFSDSHRFCLAAPTIRRNSFENRHGMCGGNLCGFYIQGDPPEELLK